MPSTATPPATISPPLLGITEAQRQALIDNFQLELTERSRKLRAQYSLQAQALRARLEMRVNRIPHALRRKNMQDLINEHATKERPAPAPPITVGPIARVERNAAQSAPTNKRILKRKSEAMDASGDKENDKENMPTQNASQELPNAKKRAKVPAARANSKATRTASRKIGPNGVLSPRSHNSGNLTRSPTKSTVPAPEKSSGVRSAVPAQGLAPRPPSRAPSRQVKRGAVSEIEGRSSEASNTSAGTTGTTIIRRPTGPRKPAATSKKAAPTKTTTAPRKKTAAASAQAAAKEKLAPASVAGGRTLRKRF